MIRAALCLLLFASSAPAARLEAAGDPIDQSMIFRIDVDVPVLRHVETTFGAHYAQRSFWTLENDGGNDRVETDFAPSAFLRHERSGWTVEGAYVHESNGRLNESSRAWNRVVVRGVRRVGNGSVGAALWASFGVEDTNPDLRRTIGDGELVARSAPWRRIEGRLRVGFTFDPPDDGPITFVRVQALAPMPRVVFDERVRALLEWRWGRGEMLVRNEELTQSLRIGIVFTP